jgi:hypothetical protein
MGTPGCPVFCVVFNEFEEEEEEDDDDDDIMMKGIDAGRSVYSTCLDPVSSYFRGIHIEKTRVPSKLIAHDSHSKMPWAHKEGWCRKSKRESEGRKEAPAG